MYFLKKATFEEIKSRKNHMVAFICKKTQTARFIIQYSRVPRFFQILQYFVTHFVYFCQFGNLLLTSSGCFVESFWLFHSRNAGHVAHIFCQVGFQAPSLVNICPQGIDTWSKLVKLLSTQFVNDPLAQGWLQAIKVGEPIP